MAKFYENNLPVFNFVIDESQDTGVKCVSIVSDPAFGTPLIAFDKAKPKFIALKDSKKQIVAGFAILANTPVYRIDPDIGEYLGVFTPEVIEQIVDKYHKEMMTSNLNLEHDSSNKIKGYLIEDYIVNSESRVNDLKSRGIEHPNALGSWYTAFKITDEKVFDNILNGSEGTGFSVEAFLDKVLALSSEVKDKYIQNKFKKEMKKVNKSLKEKILAIFTEAEKFERSLCPELAFELEWSEIGAPVNKVVVNPDGSETLTPIGQGEFVTDEGIVSVDEASNLIEVRDLPMQPEVEVEAPEVPITSGDTSISGSTATLAVTGDTTITGDQSASDSQIPNVSGTTSGDTSMKVSTGSTKCGIEKSVLEIVGNTDGQYTILVTVEGGMVTSAEAQSMVDLMLAKQTEIDQLKLSNQTLLEKLKEPITEPILDAVHEPIDFSKLSAYEKLMHKKGLTPVK